MFSTAYAGEAVFKDLPAAHWAHKSVQTLSKTGIVRGYPDGTYRPDLKVTRAQFATALVLALKIPVNEKAPQIFSDIPAGHWAFLYVDAVKSFMPTRSNPLGRFNFDGDKAITREEAAETIAVALNMKKARKPEADYLSARFKDFQNISEEFRESAALATYYGIFTGDSAGNFAPQDGLSRAEFAVVMNYLWQNKGAIEEALKPPHNPWTIEFVNFERPDSYWVKSFPDYNKIQSFYGSVTSKVYGFYNTHLVVENSTNEINNDTITTKTKTVYAYVYEKDLALFSVGDLVRLDYDRDNNITSYKFERKAR